MLKQIVKKYVPETVVDRKKMGFGFPRASWMKNELRNHVSETLFGPLARSRGWFKQLEIKNLIELHNQGIDKDRILWPLFVVELWAQKWID